MQHSANSAIFNKKCHCRLRLKNMKIKLAIFHQQGAINSELSTLVQPSTFPLLVLRCDGCKIQQVMFTIHELTALSSSLQTRVTGIPYP